jgi:hypothetical protein
VRKLIKLPDGQEIVCAVFASDEGEHLISIEERTYHVRRGEGRHYMMVRVGRHLRSISGDFEQMLQAAARVHRIYKTYETQVRRAKETAQFRRDAALNELVEE